MSGSNEALSLPPRLMVVTSATASQASGRVRLMLGITEEPGFLSFGLDVPSAHALQSSLARAAASAAGFAERFLADEPLPDIALSLSALLEAFEVDASAEDLNPNGQAPFAVAFGAGAFISQEGRADVACYVQAPGERAIAWRPGLAHVPQLATALLRAASLVQYAIDNPDNPVPSL